MQVAIADPITPYLGIKKIFNKIFEAAPTNLNQGINLVLFFIYTPGS